LREWLEPLFTAWTGITAHKLRSFLTILGITIGVAAVIALMSIGKGTEVAIVSGIQNLGTNLLFIQPGSITESGVRSATGAATSLTSEDADAISQISYVTSVAPVSGTFSQVVAGGNNMNTRITGITPEYQQILNLQPAEGDLINEQLYQSNAGVAVIGPNVKDTLFPNDDPVGQTLRLGNSVVHIIGVLQSKGASALGSTDDAILVPLTTLRQSVTQSRTSSGYNVVSSVIVQVDNQKDIGNAISDITSLLRARHRLTTPDNDFTITSQEDMIRTLSEATNSITFLLGSIAAISLLVGGIGVMNIMLVSVIERTREIGIRKALGAEEMEIVIQFLVEAAVLTLTGGIIGIIIGWGASYVISSIGTYTTFVSVDMVVLAFVISAAIGLFFGFYPAWQASRLRPIEALRHE
jgi:putative ABC transport system permease protein